MVVAIDRYTVAQVLEAISGTGGLKTRIAARLGCDHTTVTNYIKRYSTVARAWEAEKQRVDDIAEGSHIAKLEQGDSAHVLFHLKTRCKDRGYGEKIEHSVDGTLNLVVKKLKNVSADDV